MERKRLEPLLLAAATLAAAFAGVLLFTGGDTGGRAEVASVEPLALVESPNIPLEIGRLRFRDGRQWDLVPGLGSGAFHLPGTTPPVLHTLSDRGPAIDCADLVQAPSLIQAFCAEIESGGTAYLPPTLYTLQTKGGFAAVTEAVALSGLAPDAGDLDPEAVVRLADGTFWLGEETAPGLVAVAPDGRILKRLVPEGTEARFSGRAYPVVGSLPAILGHRIKNRGIEALALTPDGAYLYLTTQSPLATGSSDNAASRILRLFKIAIANGRAVAEYVYLTDEAKHFTADNLAGRDKQNAVKVSEMTMLDAERLLVLERIDVASRIHAVRLDGATDILGSRWDDPENAPTLESLDAEGLAAAGITPIAKTLFLTSGDLPGIPDKIEAMAVLPPDRLILINDNDFGENGARTTILEVRLETPW